MAKHQMTRKIIPYYLAWALLAGMWLGTAVAQQEANVEAEANVEQEAQAAAEQKARQEADARVAKLKARIEAKAEAARLKAEQKAKAEAEKRAAAEEKVRQAADAKIKAKEEANAEAEKRAAEEAKQAAEAEAVRLKAEQKAQADAAAQAAAEEKARQETEAKAAEVKTKEEAEAEKQAADGAKAEAVHVKSEQEVQAAAETEAGRLKSEQEAQAAVAHATAEKKAKAEDLSVSEAKQTVEAEAAAKAEKKAQADAQTSEAKAAKPKTHKDMLEDFAQNTARLKAERKAQADAQAAAEANAAQIKAARSDMLVDFAQKALLKNPDVLARWHNFQAATSETTAAQGGYFPRFDVSVDSGREHGQSQASNYGVNTKNITFTLTQMLYDGFATRNDVRRLNNTQLTRYYELLDASENAALEAVRAFYDVSRQRKLFELTENNYVRHRTAYEQIKLKVAAGVGRRVDLEQATGRLALSESNLTLDNANVHDASARFQRIIGELPPASMRKSPSQAKLAGQILPNAAEAVLSVAVDYHPAILAAVENVRAARYDLYGRWARYQPTLNLSVSQSHGKNLGGVDGFTSNAAAKVTLNWNLFSGGSDSARSSQYAERLNAARDLRDKTCRDIRMTLVIAYNDISKLKEQLNYLDQHQLSIEKARTAYQKQFDIGQRTLLDLLDTENELYQAKRSYINAEFDLAIAHARTLAGMGRLVNSIGLQRLETSDLPELLGTSSDASENCPPEAPIANNIQKSELDARAVEEAKAAADAARVKEEAGKEEKAKEDEKFLRTPGEAKAAAAKEKARQEAEAKAARIKAKGEAKAEAEKLEAEKKAKAEAEKQAAAETKAEAARVKAEQKAQPEAENRAAEEPLP